MDWLEQLKKDLEDARLHPSRNKKDWEIERDVRNVEQASFAGKISAEVNSKNGQHEMFRQAGRDAINKNYDKWVEKVTQGGITCREEGIIQETQYRSSQTLHKCDKCGEEGKGNLFKGLHFENCGKEKTFPQRYVFRMYNDGVLVGEYPKLKDIAAAFGRSLTNMSQMISGDRPTPNGWKFEKVDLQSN